MRHGDGGFELELISAIALDGFRTDIFQRSIEMQILERTDGNLHRHSRDQTPYFSLIDVATEDKIVHIGHSGDSGTIVESIGQNDAVPYFDRDIKDKTCNRTANECRTGFGIVLRYTVTNHFEIILGS